MTDLDLETLTGHIDRLIQPWAKPATPGCTVGILRDGEVLLQRSAGLANIELDVPIGPGTCFRVASVTKQFTCAAILLLEAEGKLSRDQEIHEHLPDLPDFGEKITLDHLMHNTSGLRDFLELMRMSGMDLQIPCSPDDLMGAIRLQRSLNFTPGSRFSYSNTNFLLLGRIVETLSGRSLGDFVGSHILAPLGMGCSRLVETTAELVPGLATGYFPQGETYVRAGHAFPQGGEGGLVSSVADLARWDHNFTTGQVGGMALVEALAQQAPFLNGLANSYARGLQVKSYRGLNTVDHGGLWPGFKTEFLRVPALNLTIIAIANNAAVDCYRLAHRVLDGAIEGRPGVEQTPALPSRPALDRLAGRYLDRESAATVEFSVAADGTPMAAMNGVPFVLEATEDGRLSAARGAFDFVTTLVDEHDSVHVTFDAGAHAVFERMPPEPIPLPNGLAARYACPELGAIWTVTTESDNLAKIAVIGPLHHTGPWNAVAIEGDQLRVEMPSVLFKAWLDVQVLRGNGTIAGLEVSGGRSKRLRFDRIA
ncbi:MAG TPA: serine hydrolase domain-containing protein [Aliidongia sp.]|uniref:serine hydrolase domain-containing protein n=1 Tax=Aliidongia sp. TaxID=1914230 RepID=UPI002DDCF36D|nr:serine hydrolase domain-containing protein [Aliidongia sp.]HEV2676290.1 serine hydrolase domain-containing protein [Aliidongia sp.]